MVGKFIKVKGFVSDVGWAKTHVPRSEFNAHSSIPSIPFLHMYKGLGLVGYNSACNSVFQTGHTAPPQNLFTGHSHILLHKLYQGLGDIKGLDRAPSLSGISSRF